jgi:HlyD family secretion protein
MSPPEGLAALRIDRTRARGRRSILPWVLLIVVIAAAFTVRPLMERFGTVDVSVATATKISATKGASGAPELSAAGYVVADRQSTLAAKVTGRLIKMSVNEAQKVKKDEVIAEVDHREIDAMIGNSKSEQQEAAAAIQQLKKAAEQSEAEVAAAKEALQTFDAENEQYKILLADAQRRLERDKKLVEGNALNKSEVDDRITEVRSMTAKMAWTMQRKHEAQTRILVAEAQAAVARSAVNVAEARLKTMESRMKVLESQLNDHFVFAPFEGVVTEKMAEVGEIVAPISIGGSMARGSIITLADWDSLQAEVDVAETQIAKVVPGQRAAITVDSIPDKVFPGKVLRILPRANRSKATVQVRVNFLQRDAAVLPEMGVRVKFLPDDAPVGAETGAIKDNIAVPKSAVFGAPGGEYVWVIVDNAAHKKPVVVASNSNDKVELKSGIVAGDKVVTRGGEKLSEDKQKVKVVE